VGKNPQKFSRILGFSPLCLSALVVQKSIFSPHRRAAASRRVDTKTPRKIHYTLKGLAKKFISWRTAKLVLDLNQDSMEQFEAIAQKNPSIIY
jgi:hypothetical protein